MIPDLIVKEMIRISKEEEKRLSGYQCFMSFTLDCFDLIPEKLSEDAIRWLNTAKKCKNGAIPQAELSSEWKEIAEYSKSLGEVIDESIITVNGAVAYLLRFMLYLENSDGRPAAGNLFFQLECFIDKFLEFFGKDDDVLDLLKKNYSPL